MNLGKSRKARIRPRTVKLRMKKIFIMRRRTLKEELEPVHRVVMI